MVASAFDARGLTVRGECGAAPGLRHVHGAGSNVAGAGRGREGGRVAAVPARSRSPSSQRGPQPPRGALRAAQCCHLAAVAAWSCAGTERRLLVLPASEEYKARAPRRGGHCIIPVDVLCRRGARAHRLQAAGLTEGTGEGDHTFRIASVMNLLLIIVYMHTMRRTWQSPLQVNFVWIK